MGNLLIIKEPTTLSYFLCLLLWTHTQNSSIHVVFVFVVVVVVYHQNRCSPRKRSFSTALTKQRQWYICMTFFLLRTTRKLYWNKLSPLLYCHSQYLWVLNNQKHRQVNDTTFLKQRYKLQQNRITYFNDLTKDCRS